MKKKRDLTEIKKTNIRVDIQNIALKIDRIDKRWHNFASIDYKNRQ